MTEVTQILSRIEDGDPHTAEQLLVLVYNELRRLAAQKLSHEMPGQTLDATGWGNGLPVDTMVTVGKYEISGVDAPGYRCRARLSGADFP